MTSRERRADRTQRRRREKALRAASLARRTAQRLAQIEPLGLPPTLTQGPLRHEPLTTGPFDQQDAHDGLGKQVDLDSILVPAIPGMLITIVDGNRARLDLLPESPHATTITVQVFATPRNSAGWVPLHREAVIAHMRHEGAPTPVVLEGRFGPEVHGTHPSRAGRHAAPSPVKVIEVSGPRWHLEARYEGASMRDREIALHCDEVLAQIVVVRGRGAMPPGAPLPLTLSTSSASREAPRKYAAL